MLQVVEVEEPAVEVIKRKYVPPVYAENELYQDRLGIYHMCVCVCEREIERDFLFFESASGRFEPATPA